MHTHSRVYKIKDRMETQQRLSMLLQHCYNIYIVIACTDFFVALQMSGLILVAIFMTPQLDGTQINTHVCFFLE